jgi:hypothetical protein
MRLALFLCFVAFTAIATAADFRPTFASEVLAPKADVVLPLLKVVCGDGVRTVTAKGEKSFGKPMAFSSAISFRQRAKTLPSIVTPAKATRLFGEALCSSPSNRVNGDPSGTRQASSPGIVGEFL